MLPKWVRTTNIMQPNVRRYNTWKDKQLRRDCTVVFDSNYDYSNGLRMTYASFSS